MAAKPSKLRRQPTRPERQALAPSREGVIILPWPPTVNHFWTGNDGGGGRHTEAAAAFLRDARAMLEFYQGRCHEGFVDVTLRLYRPTLAGDVDNRTKPVLDVLQGVAYANDRQVIGLHVFNFLSRKRPRAEVEVRAMTPAEIALALEDVP